MSLNRVISKLGGWGLIGMLVIGCELLESDGEGTVEYNYVDKVEQLACGEMSSSDYGYCVENEYNIQGQELKEVIYKETHPSYFFKEWNVEIQLLSDGSDLRVRRFAELNSVGSEDPAEEIIDEEIIPIGLYPGPFDLLKKSQFCDFRYNSRPRSESGQWSLEFRGPMATLPEPRTQKRVVVKTGERSSPVIRKEYNLRSDSIGLEFCNPGVQGFEDFLYFELLVKEVAEQVLIPLPEIEQEDFIQ